MAPVFGVKIFGKKLVISKKLFGENKTWVGVLSGMAFGIFGALMQGFLYLNSGFFKSISIIDYSAVNLIYLGYLLSFGALFGDLFKSYIKRRLNIKPGDRFVPFDQIDFVIFGFLVISLVDFPSWSIIFTGIIATFFLHIIINHIGYFLGLRGTKW